MSVLGSALQRELTSNRELARLKKLIEKLDERVDQIMNYHRLKPGGNLNDAKLTHFTSRPVAKILLKNKVAEEIKDKKADLSGLPMRASDASCLNDPLEGSALLDFLESHLKQVTSGSQEQTSRNNVSLKAGTTTTRNSKIFSSDQNGIPSQEAEILLDLAEKAIDHSLLKRDDTRSFAKEKIYLTSFSLKNDRLALWRAYGRDGEGVSLSTPMLQALACIQEANNASEKGKGPTWGLYEIKYDEDSKMRAWLLLHPILLKLEVEITRLHKAGYSSVNNYLQVYNSVSMLMHLYKHEQFSAEREVRLMAKLSNWDKRIELNEHGSAEKTYVNTPGIVFFGGKGTLTLGPKCEHATNTIVFCETLLGQAFGQRIYDADGIPIVPRVKRSIAPYR